MKYLAVLGRQPEISIAELEAIYGVGRHQTSFSDCVAAARYHGGGALILALPGFGGLSKDVLMSPSIDRFGGVLKFAVELEQSPLEFLTGLPEGKLTIGVSDYSERATRKTASQEALKLKKILVRHGRSVRVVENKDAVLSTATSLHNGLGSGNKRKVELIKVDDEWYRVIGVQDIDAYAKRDQVRPARDAKVGMLPPKLAQILINLCGPLKPGAVVLDPFCGTGVVLQEAILMGYRAYGTDISERMVDYSKKNLKWLTESIEKSLLSPRPSRPSSRGSGANSRQQPPKCAKSDFFSLSVGDATSFQWNRPIDAVACEGYLGKPFSRIPTEMELKEQKQECKGIAIGFLKNMAGQIESGTPVVIAAPAWLKSDGSYERLEVVDEIEDMGYNVNNKTREGLLYHRDGQVVARDILILRKK
ncbi:hypothetical protein IKF30_00015 [Candidatus Saccharibacteria bacterium]|nr:hypothetical protein [Candidatus Saccharibacteria bacterium]